MTSATDMAFAEMRIRKVVGINRPNGEPQADPALGEECPADPR